MISLTSNGNVMHKMTKLPMVHQIPAGIYCKSFIIPIFIIKLQATKGNVVSVK